MKNRLSPSFLFAASISAALLCAARGDDSTSLKFSDPSKPGQLRVTLGHGDLSIHGTDSTEITVKSNAKAITPTVRKDGLRVLTAAASFALSEKDNLVTLDSGWKGGNADFEISVPRGISLVIPNAFGGDIRVTDLTGDVDIKSINGEIKLQGLQGGVQVETMNGEIDATFAALPQNKPLSFTSTNGEIVVRVPADAKANVKLRTQNGTILTDFDDQSLVTKTETVATARNSRAKLRVRTNAESESDVHVAVREAAQEVAQAARDAAVVASRAARAAMAEVRTNNNEDGPRPPLPPMAALPPMTGGKLVSGTLNGGGPEIMLTAMNGDVVLRKLDGKK